MINDQYSVLHYIMSNRRYTYEQNPEPQEINLVRKCLSKRRTAIIIINEQKNWGEVYDAMCGCAHSANDCHPPALLRQSYTGFKIKYLCIGCVIDL